MSNSGGNREDEWIVHFGTRDAGFFGRYCSLRFHVLGATGHAAIDP
jgi:hypothetical protein